MRDANDDVAAHEVRDGGAPAPVVADIPTLEAETQLALVDTMTAVHDVMAASGVSLAPPGEGYLAWSIGATHCAVVLGAVRELLPALPRVTPLPESPIWLAGIFLHDNEITALVDPAHLLRGEQAGEQRQQAVRRVASGRGAFSRAPLQALVVGNDDTKLGLLVDEVAGVVYGTALPLSECMPFGLGSEIQVGSGRAYQTLDASALIAALVGELGTRDGGPDEPK